MEWLRERGYGSILVRDSFSSEGYLPDFRRFRASHRRVPLSPSVTCEGL